MQAMLSTVRSCIDDYQMIRPGDKIAVGVSGGKDSLTLLRVLAELRRFYPQPFQLYAITLSMGYEDMDFSPVAQLCRELDVPFILRETDIKSVIFDIRKEQNPCALCAKMRRGALHEEALKLGCHKVALGHHFDDAVETFLLSLIYEGRLSCFQPVTYLDRTDITLIRPLLYVEESAIRRFAAKEQLPVVFNPCPADKHTKREDVKQLLCRLETTYPALRQHIFGGLRRSPLPGWKAMPRYARDRQLAEWKQTEETAAIRGWDFSPMAERIRETAPPWDYTALVRQQLRPETILLDLDTGGGEALLSYGHPGAQTFATENYPPNLALSKQRLEPLGATVLPAPDPHALPFSDGQFDLVLCRHGEYAPEEIRRVLKPGGRFLTQQVGEDNDRAFAELLLPGLPKPFPGWNMSRCGDALEAAGLAVTDRREAWMPITITDVPALIWFATVIPWEFPGFSVDACARQLWQAQALAERRGGLEARTHRFFLSAQKPQI